MKPSMKNLTTAAVLSFAVIGGTFGTSTPAQATHQIGHAIIGGVIGSVIGNAIVNGVQRRRQPVYVQPAPVYSGYPAAHVNWCYNQYRSYHQASNTYQPYGGYPRRSCQSPYWR